MSSSDPYRIKTITEYHRLLELPKPAHPLVSVIDLHSFRPPANPESLPIRLMFDFYCISLKRGMVAALKYGQQSCDFDEGVLFCMAPGQVWSVEANPVADHAPSGWMLLVHPDFLWHTALAKTISQYGYFSYSVYEALYLSDKEEQRLRHLIQCIEQEYQTYLDKFSQPVIVAQLEVLLTYADRFYQRQFITRQRSSHQLIERVEEILLGYFQGETVAQQGLPSVGYLAQQVHVSPGYLTELLKAVTGQSAQQLIHDKLMAKAKQLLSTTDLSVSEVTYQLGFEHLASFSKLFKAKTGLTPLAFRQSFN